MSHGRTATLTSTTTNTATGRTTETHPHTARKEKWQRLRQRRRRRPTRAHTRRFGDEKSDNVSLHLESLYRNSWTYLFGEEMVIFARCGLFLCVCGLSLALFCLYVCVCVCGSPIPVVVSRPPRPTTTREGSPHKQGTHTDQRTQGIDRHIHTHELRACCSRFLGFTRFFYLPETLSTWGGFLCRISL